MLKNKGCHWAITNFCNLRCTHCLVNSGIQIGEELSFKEAKKIAQQLIKYDYKHIKFTGGEPLVKNYFWPLVKFIKRNGGKVSLISNGLLISQRNINLFKQFIYSVGISLEDSDSISNDKIRGNGSYNRAIQAIRLLVKNKIPVRLFFTLNSRSVLRIDSMIDLAVKLKVDSMRFSDLKKEGRAKKNWPSLRIPKQKHKKLREILTLTIIKKLKKKPKLIEKYKCEASLDNVFISATGDVFPCVEMSFFPNPLSLGNIKHLSLTDILKRIKLFSAEIKDSDYCPYSFLTTPFCEACLGSYPAQSCPKNLIAYQKKTVSQVLKKI